LKKGKKGRRVQKKKGGPPFLKERGFRGGGKIRAGKRRKKKNGQPKKGKEGRCGLLLRNLFMPGRGGEDRRRMLSSRFLEKGKTKEEKAVSDG